MSNPICIMESPNAQELVAPGTSGRWKGMVEIRIAWNSGS